MNLLGLGVKLANVGTNIFSNGRYGLSCVTENKDWYIKRFGEEIKDYLEKAGLIKVRIALNHFGLRNQIVHFKAVPSDNFEDSTGGSHNVIGQRIRSLNFKELLALPGDLSKELDETRELVWSRSPNYTLAREVAKSLVAYVQSGHPIKNSVIIDCEPGDSQATLSMSES